MKIDVPKQKMLQKCRNLFRFINWEYIQVTHKKITKNIVWVKWKNKKLQIDF